MMSLHLLFPQEALNNHNTMKYYKFVYDDDSETTILSELSKESVIISLYINNVVSLLAKHPLAMPR